MDSHCQTAVMHSFLNCCEQVWGCNDGFVQLHKTLCLNTGLGCVKASFRGTSQTSIVEEPVSKSKHNLSLLS